ncbi:MAG TPA: hypothetical protein VNU48_12450 [Burkholderiaceae bacterium]|nr:hypothetical protein [Burkholderiaceae bacterium]
MPKQATTRKPIPSERRSGDDRRRIEGTPPGKHDRRRGLEPRLPEVVELDMTNSEWMSLSDDPVPPSTVPPRR